MNSKRFLRCILFAALMIGLVPAAMMAAEGEPSIQVNGEVTEATNITIDNEGTNTITITGDVTLTGSGDAFTINADTELVFAEGASLTFTGYDNAFVIENGTLSGGGWHIIDGDGLDLFRLKTGSTLDITSDVDFDGNGVGNTASRAIVLPGGGAQDQAVIVANGATLHANDFYRGIETGAAQNYSVKGESKTGSTYDLSGNDCGIFINYGDRNAHYNNCTIDVKNCKTSGIFMHQHNASLNGLYIDDVVINCINDPEVYTEEYGVTGQQDIAIRFHTVAFSITDSEINIENAWNTGLWIFDGWERGNTKEIKDTTITVKNVAQSTNSSIYYAANRRKAITVVPYGEWTIDGCTINMIGDMQCGLNIGNDTGITQGSGFLNYMAKPSMYGGTINLQDTKIYTEQLTKMDIGVQIGQFLNIKDNVLIDNDYQNDTDSPWTEHYTILCDKIGDRYPVNVIGFDMLLQYDSSGMSEETKADKRVKVTGGSYWSTNNANLDVFGQNVYDSSRPVNHKDEPLEMFEVSPLNYETYVENNGITLIDSTGESYVYKAVNATQNGDDINTRYIWAPAVTVSFVDIDGNEIAEYTVPRGAAFGLTVSDELPDGDLSIGNNLFTKASVISDDTVVTVA